jgi:hypothetical protein
LFLKSVKLISPHSSDWQLEIKALEFQDAASIEKSLGSFTSSIRFKSEAARGGLIAEPKRKVLFATGAPVSRLIEKSALRYILKGTNYVLELARYDEFRRVGLHVDQGDPQQHANADGISDVPVTYWGASMYDMEWDNKLGQHANFGVGHSAGWHPTLNTFFPDWNDPDTGNNRSGFHQFLSLVGEVSKLLCPQRKKDSFQKPKGEKTGAKGKKPDQGHPATGPRVPGASSTNSVSGSDPVNWSNILASSGAVF